MDNSRRAPTSPPSSTFHPGESTTRMISLTTAFPHGLPLLPSIRNEHMHQQVFTHRSFYGRPAKEFEADPHDPRLDNESLEHLGDSVIQYCTTLLVRQLYPHLSPGAATQIRSSIVDNRNLADIAGGYKFSQHLRISSSAPHIRSSKSLQADAFEAYVGGLHEDQGLQVVYNWLAKLFTPYIHAMYEEAALTKQMTGLSIGSSSPVVPKPKHRRNTTSSATAIAIPPISPTTTFSNLTTSTTDAAAASSSSAAPQRFIPEGCTAELNERLSQRHQMAHWIDRNVAPGEDPTYPDWRSQAIVDGQVVGVGHGGKIKSARNVAAYYALITLGLGGPTDS